MAVDYWPPCSAWLYKARRGDAWGTWLQHYRRRYFTLDFDKQILFYSRGEGSRKVSMPIPFENIKFATCCSDEEAMVMPVESMHSASSYKKSKLAKELSEKSSSCKNSLRKSVLSWFSTSQYYFRLDTRYRLYQLAADSEEVARSWVEMLNVAHRMGRSRSFQQTSSCGQAASRDIVHSADVLASVGDKTQPECVDRRLRDLASEPGFDPAERRYSSRLSTPRNSDCSFCPSDDSTNEGGSNVNSFASSRVPSFQIADPSDKGFHTADNRARIHVESYRGWQCAFDMCPRDTIHQLKLRIHSQKDVPVDKQSLTFQGIQLENHCTLDYYKIGDTDTITLVPHIQTSPDSTSHHEIETSAERHADIDLTICVDELGEAIPAQVSLTPSFGYEAHKERGRRGSGTKHGSSRAPSIRRTYRRKAKPSHASLSHKEEREVGHPEVHRKENVPIDDSSPDYFLELSSVAASSHRKTTSLEQKRVVAGSRRRTKHRVRCEV